MARLPHGRAQRGGHPGRGGGQPARRQVVVRDPFVPDRGVAQDQVAGLQVALQAARGADGDHGGGAQGGQFLQRRGRGGRPDAEPAEQAHPAAGARQRHRQRPPRPLDALGPQHVVVQRALVAEHHAVRSRACRPARPPAAGRRGSRTR